MTTMERGIASGVSFGLNEDQKALRELAHEFAEKEIRPRAAEYDEHSIHPADVIAKAHELGLLNAHVPAEYGGLELSVFDGMLIGEELAWGCSGMATSLAANTLGAAPVLIAGTDEQKRRFVAPLVDEPILCSFALTEPNAGSDVSGIQTTAVRRGDEYVLNGSKMFITNAGHAAWLVVFASTDKSKRHRGLSAFVVPAGLDGVVVERHLDKMGQRATDTSAIAFQDVRVPVENRLGEEGDGFRIAMATFDRSRPTVAAQAVGLGQGAVDLAVDYALRRHSFGEPLAGHQGIQFKLADMEAQVAAARALTFQAATAIDDDDPRLTKLASMAKLVASEAAMRVSTDAVQVLGGNGYLKDFPAERMMRDAKVLQIYEGANEIQRLVIARQLVKEAARREPMWPECMPGAEGLSKGQGADAGGEVKVGTLA